MAASDGGASDMDAVLNFMAVTGATQDVAEQYVVAARGDVDAAVATFFETEGAAGDVTSPGPSVGADPGALASVEDILGKANQASEAQDDVRRWGGGARLGGPGPEEERAVDRGNMRSVALLFFADGYCVDEEVDERKAEQEAEEAAAAAAPKAKAAPRRTGMMTLDDMQKASGPGALGGKMPKIPKLPPLRSYDTPEDKAFLDELKGGGVPKELRRTDEAGKPIGVSIGVQDLRPKTYKELAAMISQFEKMAAKAGGESASAAPPATGPKLFAGSGHTLSSSSSAAQGSAAAPASGATSGGGADPALLAIVAAAPAPVADELKPTTTLQLRLASGARARAKLNLDHTVADVWRLVAAQMGQDAFAAASCHELAAGFPPKPLNDPGATLAAADLANASITHRCK